MWDHLSFIIIYLDKAALLTESSTGFKLFIFHHLPLVFGRFRIAELLIAYRVST